MEQQELINKIKTLLPEPFGWEILEHTPDGLENDSGQQVGFDIAINKVHKALPDIINYIYEDLRGKINEKYKLNDIPVIASQRCRYAKLTETLGESKARKNGFLSGLKVVLSLLEITSPNALERCDDWLK